MSEPGWKQALPCFGDLYEAGFVGTGGMAYGPDPDSDLGQVGALIDAKDAQIAGLVAALEGVWPWLDASLGCDKHPWDAGQREAAERGVVIARAALANLEGA